MKIGFDAKRLFNNFTGLGNYSRFVVSALLESGRDDSFILYTPDAAKRGHPDIQPIVAAPQVEIVTPPAIFRWTKTSSLWRSFIVGHEPSTTELDVFHGLSQELPAGLPAKVKKIVTVHDLIFLRFPQLYSRIDARIYTYKVAKACRDADVVIAISQQTAQDIMSFLDVPESKIKVIYQGTHPQFAMTMPAETLASARHKWRLPTAYILTVGTIEPRKNMLVAIEALAKLPMEMRIPLVVVGRETAYKHTVADRARELDVADLVIFLHQIPFHDLPAIYQGATLFIYPSLFEGFGIPIVEALQSRVPVVTSTGSCFSEAGGTAALYADPGNSDDVAFHLLRVLSDPQLQQTMIARGTEQVRRFAPDVIAEELRRVYGWVPR